MQKLLNSKIVILGTISFAYLVVFLVQSSHLAQAATQGSLMGYWKLDQTTPGSTFGVDVVFNGK